MEQTMSPDATTNIRICPLCGTRGGQTRFRERDSDIVLCNVCGLLFVWPYPDLAQRDYSHVHHYDYDSLTIVDPTSHREASELAYNHWFPKVARDCLGAKSVLDVGCGTGILLKRLKKIPGLVCEGIELNEQRAEEARVASGCVVHSIPLEELPAEKRFDRIVLMDVVSHLPGFDVYGEIRNRLTDDGLLILKTGECARNVEKVELLDWQTPDHLHFLGTDTLQVLCDKFSFEVVKHERIPVSRELFANYTFRARGRSRWRNLVKTAALKIPGSLRALQMLYDTWRGHRIFVSYIVLRGR